MSDTIWLHGRKWRHGFRVDGKFIEDHYRKTHLFFKSRQESEEFFLKEVEESLKRDLPSTKSDSSQSKDMPRGLSARGGGEEEADEDCPSGRPLGASPNINGGMVENLDPELKTILKHRKRMP